MNRLIFISYGKKNGVPENIDLNIDARILPNPFYVSELKDKNGTDSDVYNYVIDNKLSKDFFQNVIPFLDFYLKEIFKKKEVITIGIMCTGGQHRSVSVAIYLYSLYKDKYNSELIHRDI